MAFSFGSLSFRLYVLLAWVLKKAMKNRPAGQNPRRMALRLSVGMRWLFLQLHHTRMLVDEGDLGGGRFLRSL